MHFLDLPPEMIHQVLSCTVPSSLTPVERNEQLLSLSLVCHAFRSPAQTLLWAQVYVDVKADEGEESSWDQWRAQLFLREKEGTSFRVKALQVVNLFWQEERELGEVLKRCRGLKKLVLAAPRIGGGRYLLEESELHYLSLAVLDCSAMNELHTIVLENVCFVPPTPRSDWYTQSSSNATANPSNHLRSLVNYRSNIPNLHSSFLPYLSLFRLFLEQSIATTYVGSPSLSLSEIPSIERHTLTFLSIDNGLLLFNEINTATLLRQLTSLRTLFLTIFAGSVGPVDHHIPRLFRDNLPHATLEYIGTRVIGNDKIYAMLRELFESPTLRNVKGWTFFDRLKDVPGGTEAKELDREANERGVILRYRPWDESLLAWEQDGGVDA